MIDRLLAKVFGTQHERDIKKMLPRVERINALEPAVKALSDDDLRAKTLEFRARIATALEGVHEEDLKAARAAILDDLLEEAFAVAREASVRALGMRPFDVQLIGGMVLHSGKIAEMKTGEGKTLVGTMPVYLNALTGRGVHVVTVNDYLARRDAEWMGRIYKFLGLTVGCIQNSLLDDEGGNLDPHRIWAAMMANEKPGGHGERSVAVGTLDMAVWDAVAKIAGKPLFRLLA